MKPGASRRARRALLSLVLTNACYPSGSGNEPDSEATGPASEASSSEGGGDDSTATTSTTSTSGEPLPGVTSTVEPTTTGESTGDATTSTSGDTTTGDTTTGDTSGGTGGPKSCKKVDIVLAIENSPDMSDGYWQIEDMAKHLAERLGSDLADWDYHVMVVDADASWGQKACEDRCALNGYCDLIPEYPCSYDPTACDATLGAGVVYPAGKWAANTDCGLTANKRYVDNETSNLGEALQCLTKVGFSSDWRSQIQSLLDAVSGPPSQLGGCNDGFLRDDAFLIAVSITGTKDEITAGTAEEWHKAMLATKGGNFDKVFMVGLINDGWYPESVCGLINYGGNTQKLEDFVNLFFRKSFGSFCEPDYAPFLDPALDYLHTACKA